MTLYFKASQQYLNRDDLAESQLVQLDADALHLLDTRREGAEARLVLQSGARRFEHTPGSGQIEEDGIATTFDEREASIHNIALTNGDHIGEMVVREVDPGKIQTNGGKKSASHCLNVTPVLFWLLMSLAHTSPS